LVSGSVAYALFEVLIQLHDREVMLCSHLFDRVFEFLVQPKIRYKYLNLLYGLSLANPSLFVDLVVELFAQGIHFDLLSGH
jgi:hypothetical protein